MRGVINCLPVRGIPLIGGLFYARAWGAIITSGSGLWLDFSVFFRMNGGVRRKKFKNWYLPAVGLRAHTHGLLLSHAIRSGGKIPSF